MKKIAIILLICLALTSSASAAQLVSEQYVVKSGDCLTTIALHYAMKLQITNPTAIKEFREGILEYNYSILKDRDAQEGDVLIVNYWRFDS